MRFLSQHLAVNFSTILLQEEICLKPVAAAPASLAGCGASPVEGERRVREEGEGGEERERGPSSFPEGERK